MSAIQISESLVACKLASWAGEFSQKVCILTTKQAVLPSEESIPLPVEFCIPPVPEDWIVLY